MADPVYLPDVNILVAAHLDVSPFHALARAWLSQVRQFATTSATETGMVRVLMAPRPMPAAPAGDALRALERLRGRAGHRFWPDGATLTEPLIDLRGLIGHRQITGYHLVNLAALHGGVLATWTRRSSDRSSLPTVATCSHWHRPDPERGRRSRGGGSPVTGGTAAWIGAVAGYRA